MTRVYTGGTFDLFHAGHVNFLKQCRKIADLTLFVPDKYPFTPDRTVTVALNTDDFIYEFKGRYPVYDYDERKALLESCKYVDKVVPNYGLEDSRPVIEDERPNFIIIGDDWARKDYYKQMGFTQEWLDSKNIQLVYVPYTEGISTTRLKQRILAL